MASMTYYVALAFTRSEGGDIIACEPKEARSSNQAIRMADSLATTEGHCGAIAFSRSPRSLQETIDIADPGGTEAIPWYAR